MLKLISSSFFYKWVTLFSLLFLMNLVVGVGITQNVLAKNFPLDVQNPASLSTDTPSVISVSIGLPWLPGNVGHFRQHLHGSNNAIDLGTPNNQVWAAEDGVVAWRYETCIGIRRQDGAYLVGYQHINSTDIASWHVGDQVQRGDLIGNTTTASGCHGYSTGPHVHFWVEGSGISMIDSSFGDWTLTPDCLQKNGECRYPSLVDSASNAIAYEAIPPTPPPPTTIYANTLADGGVWMNAYGTYTDTFATGDFDGDGLGDIVIITLRLNGDNNPATPDLAFFVMTSSGTNFVDRGQWMNSFGQLNDKILVADFDGDGKDDIVVGTERVNGAGGPLAWYWLRSTGTSFIDGGQIESSYGLAGDRFYAVDFNGDHKQDILVSTTRINGDGNPVTQDLAWYLMKSNGQAFVDGGLVNLSYGLVEDRYYIGDFDGDGNEDVIVGTDRINGDGNALSLDMAWYVMRSNGTSLVDLGQVNTSYGLAEDQYFIGDIDGDGKDDLLTVTARVNGDSSLRWYVARSNGYMFVDAGVWAQSYGVLGDAILVNDFRPGDYATTASADAAFARNLSGAMRWWVMYSDHTDGSGSFQLDDYRMTGSTAIEPGNTPLMGYRMYLPGIHR